MGGTDYSPTTERPNTILFKYAKNEDEKNCRAHFPKSTNSSQEEVSHQKNTNAVSLPSEDLQVFFAKHEEKQIGHPYGRKGKLLRVLLE